MAEDKKKVIKLPDPSKTFLDPNSQGLERPSSAVEIFAKATEEVYSTENIELKTELTDRQIIAFSRAKVFANRYGCSLLNELVDNLSIYSVSRGRKGRKEFENIAKANLGMSQEDEARSIPDRLLGRR